MFFVLSGFLITSIIWREAKQGQYSMARFYERRIRRILPALLLVLFLTTVAAAIILLPADLIGYGKSLIATLTFVANIYFWRDTNYFARSAEYKPLLHMWSLGVEEQFYIFYPLLLAFLVRFNARIALFVTAGLAFMSFAANAFLNYVGTDSGVLFLSPVRAAFYLLPTRAWELGLGAAIALLPVNFAVRKSAGIVSFLGVVLVLLGIFFPNPVPWFMPVGVPVVLGTALLVFAGRQALPPVNRALSLSPVVFIGLISYSLYLWHWPVLVLLRYYFINGVPLAVMCAALAVIAVGAFLSWRFVECPFRSKRMNIRNVVFTTGSSAAVLALIALVIVRLHGLPSRYNEQASAFNAAIGSSYRCPVPEMISHGDFRACPLNLPSRNPADAEVVLLGNSHAQMYAPAWRAIFVEHHIKGLLVPLIACLPTVQANLSADCARDAQRNLTNVLSLPHVRTVILAFTWWHGNLTNASGQGLDNRNNRALIGAIDDLDRQLHNAGKRVILIGPIAWPGWDVPTTLSRELAFGSHMHSKLYMPEASFRQHFGAAIQHFASQKSIAFVPAYNAQCRNGACYYVIDGRSLYSDDNHISMFQLWRFHSMFESAYKAVSAEPRQFGSLH